MFSSNSLLQAVSYGDDKAVAKYLKEGADLTSPRLANIAFEHWSRSCILEMLLKHGMVPKLKLKFLDNNKYASWEVLSKYKFTLDGTPEEFLMTSIYRGLYDFTDAMLVHYPDIDKSNYKIMEASLKIYNTKLALRLADSGFNVIFPSDHKHNALQLAVKSTLDESRLVNVLVNKGIDINAVDENGDTTLHIFLRNMYMVPETLECILKAGANTELVNKKGFAPLHILANNEYATSEIITILGKYCKDVNVRTPKGNNALHLATYTTYIDLDIQVSVWDSGYDGQLVTDPIFSLVDLKIDLNAVNNEGKTPLELATKGYYSRSSYVLRKLGAVFNKDNPFTVPSYENQYYYDN